jgi:hypothetical protein
MKGITPLVRLVKDLQDSVTTVLKPVLNIFIYSVSLYNINVRVTYKIDNSGLKRDKWEPYTAYSRITVGNAILSGRRRPRVPYGVAS